MMVDSGFPILGIMQGIDSKGVYICDQSGELLCLKTRQPLESKYKSNYSISLKIGNSL
jgi:hypothetical protein